MDTLPLCVVRRGNPESRSIYALRGPAEDVHMSGRILLLQHKTSSPRNVERFENSCRQYRIRSSRGEESALCQQLLVDGSVARRTFEKCRLGIYNVDEGKSSKIFCEARCRRQRNDLAFAPISGDFEKNIKSFSVAYFFQEIRSTRYFELSFVRHPSPFSIQSPREEKSSGRMRRRFQRADQPNR